MFFRYLGSFFNNSDGKEKEVDELVHQRQQLQFRVHNAQLLTLAAAGALFFSSSAFNTASALLIGVYLERGIASYYEKVLSDFDTAKHLADNYSTVSRFSYFFDPFIIKAAQSGANWVAEQATIKPRPS